MKLTMKNDPVTGNTLKSAYTATVDYVVPTNYAIEGSDSKYSYMAFTIAPSTNYNRIITGLSVTTRYTEETKVIYLFFPNRELGLNSYRYDYYTEFPVYDPITKKTTNYKYINSYQGDLAKYNQYELVDRPTSQVKVDGKNPYETKEEMSTMARSVSAVYNPEVSSGVDISTITVTPENRIPITDKDTDSEREIAELINNNPDVYLRQIKDWSYFLFEDKQTFNSVYNIFMNGANAGIKWVAAPCGNMEIVRKTDNPGYSSLLYGYKLPRPQYSIKYYDSANYYVHESKETNKASTLWYQTVESKKRNTEDVENTRLNLKYLVSKASGSVFGEGSIPMAIAVTSLLLIAAYFTIIKRKKIRTLFNFDDITNN